MAEAPQDLIRLSRAGDGAAEVVPLDLGARVRELRHARGWTLAEAAARAGLARSTLSKIENRQMSPTFEAMRKLARGLDIAMPQLFVAARKPGDPARLALGRMGQGSRHPTPTYEHELLAGDIADKRMLPYRTRVRARRLEEFDGWVRHDGEEFLLVLTGIIRLYTEFHEPVDMRRGDSAYYDAAMGHNVVSVSEDDATILWVTSLV